MSGKTGAGGAFSGGKFDDRSMFNKEKWLPLAQLPIPISHYCCGVMKKAPMNAYAHREKRVPIIGVMASESRMRKQAWIRHGCNAFDSKKPQSQPMAFWTEQDVLEYIKRYDLQIAPVYGDIVEECADGQLVLDGYGKLKCTGCNRVGCIYCAFGAHLEKGETRFQRLARTHPQLYDYCMRGGQWVDNPAYDATAPEMDGEWKNWNPKKSGCQAKTALGCARCLRWSTKNMERTFLGMSNPLYSIAEIEKWAAEKREQGQHNMTYGLYVALGLAEKSIRDSRLLSRKKRKSASTRQRILSGRNRRNTA